MRGYDDLEWEEAAKKRHPREGTYVPRREEKDYR